MYGSAIDLQSGDTRTISLSSGSIIVCQAFILRIKIFIIHSQIIGIGNRSRRRSRSHLICVVKVTHVCTRILIPDISTTFIQRVVIIAVTASECLVDLVCTIDLHKSGWYRSSITTAIHLSDARQFTTVDNYLCAGCIQNSLII